MRWRIHHKDLTESTNSDARAGKPWDVFTADEQTAGRGRLTHVWHSAAGVNLMCSAVVDVGGLDPAAVATFPLVVGLSVLKTVRAVRTPPLSKVAVKWPNDVLVNGRKLAGILCERMGDNVIAGIGINVNQCVFPPEIEPRTTSLARECPSLHVTPKDVLKLLLNELGTGYSTWRNEGFAALHPQLAAYDWLKGRTVSVLQTDDDPVPLVGLCEGISSDGTLIVNGTPVYAGEAHITLY